MTKGESVSRSILSCDPMDWDPPGFSIHGFSRQEYWGRLPFPSPEDLPDLGSNLGPCAAGKFFTASTTREIYK